MAIEIVSDVPQEPIEAEEIIESGEEGLDEQGFPEIDFEDADIEETGDEEYEEAEYEEVKPEPEEIPSHLSYLTEEERGLYRSLPKESKKAFAELERKREAFTSRKSQALSEQMRQAESLGALAQAVQADPALRAHIANYGKQQEQPEEQPPADAFERLQWEAKNKAKEEVMAQVGPMIQQLQNQQAQAQHADAVRQAMAPYQQDPQFKSVRAGMDEVVAHVYRTEGKQAADQLYHRLDTDPQAFGQLYKYVREKMPSQRKATPTAPKLQGTGKPPAPPRPRKKAFEDAKQRVVNSSGKVESEAVGDMLSAAFGDI